MRQMRAILLVLGLILIPLSCGQAETQNAPLAASSHGVLKVAFLDVGQGDAIYIEAPNGTQMVIDGGPAGTLMGPLSEVMPFGDRSINVIMVTNPDADHYAGFVDLLKSYDVGAVIEPGTMTGTSLHAELQKGIYDKGIPEILARRGMTIDLDPGAGARFTVLFPDRDVSGATTNDGSIEGVLTYGSTKIMFTGDGTKKTEAFVVSGNTQAALASDILKVAHHGSDTSSSEAFVAAVAPKWAVISVGLHNSYRLPKQSTIDTLTRHGAEILRTDMLGTIVFTSDGTRFIQQK